MTRRAGPAGALEPRYTARAALPAPDSHRAAAAPSGAP